MSEKNVVNKFRISYLYYPLQVQEKQPNTLITTRNNAGKSRNENCCLLVWCSAYEIETVRIIISRENLTCGTTMAALVSTAPRA